MSTFELKSFPNQIVNPDDVMEFAKYAQAKIDTELPPDFTRDDLNRLANTLDRATRGIYLGSKVAISGIQKIFSPNPHDLEEPIENLKDGLTEGVSNGFAVVPVTNFEPPYLVDDYDEQMTLYEKIRRQVNGEFVVSHMITHDHSQPLLREDHGLSRMHGYHALGPVRASSLWVYDEHEAEVNNDDLQNAKTILDSVGNTYRTYLDIVAQEMRKTRDPLKAMVRTSYVIDHLVNNFDENLVLAFYNLLSGGGDGPLMMRPYTFNAMPPAIIENETATSLAPELDPQIYKLVFVEALALRGKYCVNNDGRITGTSDKENVVYLNFRGIVNANLQTSFSVPLSLIKEGSFRRVIA